MYFDGPDLTIEALMYASLSPTVYKIPLNLLVECTGFRQMGFPHKRFQDRF